MSSAASGSSDADAPSKHTSTRSSTRAQSLNSIQRHEQLPSPLAVESNAWKQVKIEHAREVEEALLERCESFYQLILQRLNRSSSDTTSAQSISDSIAPILSSAPIDLMNKCSRVGSRYQAELPSKLSIEQRSADTSRFPEHVIPFISPDYWKQTGEQLANQPPNSSTIQPLKQSISVPDSISSKIIITSRSKSPSKSPIPINITVTRPDEQPRPHLCGGAVALGKQILTRDQEYHVRYLSSPPAFPAFEFVRSKLCSPLALKYRSEVLRKRARAAEARLGLVRVGRGRRSTRNNPALLPPPKPPAVVDVAKQMSMVWERMLNTGGRMDSKDGRATLAKMVHEITKDKSLIDLSEEVEIIEKVPVTQSRSKKQKIQ